MPEENPFSEKLETGDVVPIDQTVTLRTYHAKKRVKGKFQKQCHKCGGYFTEGEETEHALHCFRPVPVKRKWRKRTLRRAMRAADKEGKLAEFIAKML